MTLIHVLWFSFAVGATFVVYATMRDASVVLRVIVTIGAFFLLVGITHVGIVFIVTASVIPRLTPGSRWEREFDSYMDSVFPRK